MTKPTLIIIIVFIEALFIGCNSAIEKSKNKFVIYTGTEMVSLNPSEYEYKIEKNRIEVLIEPDEHKNIINQLNMPNIEIQSDSNRILIGGNIPYSQNNWNYANSYFYIPKEGKLPINQRIQFFRTFNSNEINKIQKQTCTKNIEFITTTDKIQLESNEFIIQEFDLGLQLTILDKSKISHIRKTHCPIITFCIDGKRMIAKCHALPLSLRPVNCDYIYYIKSNRTIKLSKENILVLKKIEKIIV